MRELGSRSAYLQVEPKGVTEASGKRVVRSFEKKGLVDLKGPKKSLNHVTYRETEAQSRKLLVQSPAASRVAVKPRHGLAIHGSPLVIGGPGGSAGAGTSLLGPHCLTGLT